MNILASTTAANQIAGDQEVRTSSNQRGPWVKFETLLSQPESEVWAIDVLIGDSVYELDNSYQRWLVYSRSQGEKPGFEALGNSASKISTTI